MSNWQLLSRVTSGRRLIALGLVMLLAVVAFWYLWEARLSNGDQVEGILDVSPDQLAEVLGQGKPVVLEFYTSVCPWCAAIEPELERLSETYGKQITIAKMNAEKYPYEAVKYGITGVPSLILHDAGGKPLAIASGYRPFDELVDILKNYKLIK
ncbi:MAG TPA: thioredoxin family protein [Firmicutes bacterium]|nr:thioredoxin family protein [Candidatus Fermentithermobacillaceae bacterium]